MPEDNNDLTRRKFLATSLGGLVAASVGGLSSNLACFKGDTGQSTGISGPPVKRTLGRTGIEIPIVGAGAGPGFDPGFIMACYDIGLRLFDTDARYRGGRHEQLLGRVFNRMKNRDRVIIVTKVHPPEKRVGLSDTESKNRFYREVEGSLRRLQTDYIDILMIQDISDRRTVHNAAMIEAMTRVKEQGKTRFIGVATHAGMAAVINAMIEAEVYDTVLTSINFTMADDSALLGAIESAAQKGIGVIAMKTQAGGYAFPNADTLRQYSNSLINSAALKWVCHNENIATSIPGMANYDHMRADFQIAVNPEYTDEEKKFLSDNRVALSMEFCRQCRYCVAICPDKVDIPTLMRTHMYARQYADFALARQTFDSLKRGRGLDICVRCSECLARCARSVNIPRKIDELKLIYA